MIRETRGTSLPTRAVALVRASALAVAVAALAGCATGGGPSSATTPPGPAATTDPVTFREEGLIFDYQGAWHVVHDQMDSSFSHLIAYLATVDVPEPCVTTQLSGSTQIACGDRYVLTPDSLVVTVSSNGRPGFEILNRPANATPLVVDGLPAYLERSPATTGGDTETLTWTLARPGTVDNFYTIRATLRGPDLAPVEAELQALIASLRYDPPVVPLPSGAGAAPAAAASALAVLSKDAPAWACLVTMGTKQLVIDSLPMGPALAHPQLATCTSAIEATPLQLWRMTLAMHLSEPDANAGSGETFVVWVNPDGTPGLTSGGPLAP